MGTDSVRRSNLLQQVKRGKPMGAIQFARIFLILLAGAEMFRLISDAHQGKANINMLVSALLLVFILAISAFVFGRNCYWGWAAFAL